MAPLNGHMLLYVPIRMLENWACTRFHDAPCHSVLTILLRRLTGFTIAEYGRCGIGAYCLGGCDPRMSFSLESCVPEPQCESKIFPMISMDGIIETSKYLGDPKTADWVYQGTPLVYNNESILLTMPAKSVGTVLATTTYMWFGTVTARLKTSRGAGVVTAFILLSDVKDEIDFEFVGTELGIAQTNYYFQGIPVCKSCLSTS